MKIKAFPIYILLLIILNSVSGQDPGKTYNLKQLIDSALQNNYLIKANEKQKAVRQSDIELLRVAYQPRISASATASVWKFLLPNKQRLLGNSLTDVYTDISVYQTIYDFGENKIKQSSVEDEILISDEIQRQLRSTIIWGVADTYYEILKAESEVNVHRNTLDQLRSHLKFAEALYTIGKVSGVDVLKINVQISVEEKALQKSENSVQSYNLKLSRLCFPEKLSSFDIEDHTDTLFVSAHSRILVPDSIYAETLNNHPSIKAANLKINLEEKQKEIARLQNRPELYSYGTGTWEHGYIPFGNNFNYNIGVGIHYTIPLFGGSGYKTKMLQSDLRVHQINDEKTQLFLDLLREIDLTLSEIKDIQDEISNNQKIISLARETLENASVRYQGGQGTIIDVLDAQAILSETTINYQESMIGFLQALAKLKYLTGNDKNPY